MSKPLDGQLSALDLLGPARIVDGRIECPHCASHWGEGLKPQALDRLAEGHAEISPGICQWMLDVKEAIPSAWDRHNGKEPGWSLTKPVPPMFTANVSAWQVGGCGWCGRKSVIGGSARQHPKYPDISIYYEYCAKCFDLYGDPKIWHPDFKLQLNHDMTSMLQREPGLEAKLTEIRARMKEHETP